MKRDRCMTSAYKQALRDIARQMGFSRKRRVPKHVRKDLQRYAEYQAKVICSGKKG